jgi:hypothetical protein
MTKALVGFIAAYLVVSTASSDELSERANRIAKHYLARECADGRERFVVVTGGLKLHDLSADSQPSTVAIDTPNFRALCAHGPLFAHHCHAQNAPTSVFPGVSLWGTGSDIGSAVILEYHCASEAAARNFAPTHIEHFMVHTGGDSAIVRFGIRGALLEEARSLGKQASTNAATRGTNSLTPEAERLVAKVSLSYLMTIIDGMGKACPKVLTSSSPEGCPAYTAEKVASAMDPCGDYFIVPPGFRESPRCRTASKSPGGP